MQQQQLHPAPTGSWSVPITGARMLVSRQRNGSREGLADTCFKGILSKNTTDSDSLYALNLGEHKPSLLSPSLFNSTWNCFAAKHFTLSAFKSLAKRCCCVVLAHHVQSLPSSQLGTVQTVRSVLLTNLPTPTAFPLCFCFCFLHIHPIFVSF